MGSWLEMDHRGPHTSVRSLTGGGFIVVVSYHDGADHFTINGGSTVQHVVALETGSDTGIQIGSRISPGEYAQFDCGEVLAFSRALPEAERQKIEGYLAHKWNLTGVLPGSHPYKRIAP